jgi:hypothetical protein
VGGGHCTGRPLSGVKWGLSLSLTRCILRSSDWFSDSSIDVPSASNFRINVDFLHGQVWERLVGQSVRAQARYRQRAGPQGLAAPRGKGKWRRLD